MSRKDQSRWFGLIGFFKELRRLQQFELQKQQQQQHLRHFTSSISIVWRKSIDFIQLPIATGPVAVGDAHHDEEEDEAEEDEPGDDVHDRRGDRDGHRRLHLRHLAPDVAHKAEVVVYVFSFCEKLKISATALKI